MAAGNQSETPSTSPNATGWQHYPDVDPKPSFPEIEREVLAFWQREGIFERSVDARPTGENGSNEYVFYDGPPFANGLPHYGHLITSYIKDVIPRYQTLRGRRVERRFGWDCHGLPAELEAEKELGVGGRTQIIEFGIDLFNAQCRKSVLKYTVEWQRYVNRAARWVDFENDYKTLYPEYMESLIWALKQFWDRGLLYEGYRVMPYSWAAQTPLSNFETRMDDSYRERQDPAITLRFELVPESGDDGPMDLLAWTTTPWTLPSNLALAVGKDIDYAIYQLEGRRLVLAESTVGGFERELAAATRVGSAKGSEFSGRRYRPLFPFFESTANSFRVLEAAFVNTEEGTGIVHLAPGFGEDDMDVCKDAGIPVVCPVDDAGCFTNEVGPWAGLQVFEANTPIIRELRSRDKVFREASYVHNYPHCWRTDTPLIYKALNSWYIKVSALRDRMVEVNQEINWIPGHVKDGLFGKWLEGARDWSISRNRFWGTPIPIWKSDDPAYPRIDVYGSLDELERDFGVRPADLHRPFIDELVRPNPDDPSGESRMRRVPEVLDCWFESGSMFYAQAHYPFENKDWFENHFPGDFVSEYLSQTRGWFYTMTVLSVGLFDRAPFRNCLCHGILLDATGKKLSKRLRNYPDPEEVFETFGSDALRWFLISSHVVRGGDLRIEEDGRQIADAVRRVLNPLWNAYYFFCLYANTDNIRASFAPNPTRTLDRYIIAKTHDLVVGMQEDLDAYEVAAACQRVLGHIDALNNWYIRRSRPRFWRAMAGTDGPANNPDGADDTDSADNADNADNADKQAAYDTLYTVLVTLCQVVSPLLPLISEEVYRGLTGSSLDGGDAPSSVHLCDWPGVGGSGQLAADPDLVADMDRVRDVCSSALALRAAHDVRVRQPLAELVVAGLSAERLRPYLDLICDEVNVKSVRLSEEIDEYATFRLQVNARALGPRLGKRTKQVIAASKKGDWRSLPDTDAGGGQVEVALDDGGETLEEGEYSLLLQPKDGVACESLPGNDAIVVLDLELSADLVDEGLARDVVRAVQQARKEAEFHVADRIHLMLRLPDRIASAVENFRAYVAEQTLAVELSIDRGDAGEPSESASRHETQIGGETLHIAILRADRSKTP